MTQDEIIDMARQARLPYYYQDGAIVNLERLEAFAKLVAASEREACALVCEVIDEDIRHHEDVAACAKAIRARGGEA